VAKPKKNRTGLKVGGAVAALLIAFGIGAGSTEAQTVEVERVVEKPVEKIVTETIEKEVTPADCIEALDLAGAAIELMAEIPENAGEGIVAAGTGDVAGLNAVTAKMEVVNEKINKAAGPLGVATQSCRAQAE
jgi:hypothetical protein